MADEEVKKTETKKQPKGRRELGTETVARTRRASQIEIDPDAHLPAVLDTDLHDIAIDLPEPELYLEIPEGLPFEEWKQAGERIRPLAERLTIGGEVITRYGNSMMWRVGDVLVYGERMKDNGVEGYATEYDQYMDGELFGYSPDTARKCLLLASAIPPAERVKGLTFSHHEVVYKKVPAERKRWLNKALAGGWSVQMLREQVFPRKEHDDKKNGKKRVKLDTAVVNEFTLKDLERCHRAVWDFYDMVTDMADAIEKKVDPAEFHEGYEIEKDDAKNGKVVLSFTKLGKLATAAAIEVQGILLGIGEQLKDSEAA